MKAESKWRCDSWYWADSSGQSLLVGYEKIAQGQELAYYIHGGCTVDGLCRGKGSIRDFKSGAE